MALPSFSTQVPGPMHPLAATDVLPLTCTREGTCCHGHQIWINPWELARLASAAGLSREDFRARHTDCQGTRLLFNGPAGWRDRPACSLYDPSKGCTAHAGRPLTCRMYPLGRARREGAVIYYHAGDRLPCYDLCPSVVNHPSMTVGDYVAGQDVTAGAIATDAYANLVYGMIGVVKSLCDHGPQAGVEVTAIHQSFEELAGMTPETRTTLLPQEWVDLLTLLPDELVQQAPADTVRLHGERINAMVQNQMNQTGASLTDVAHLYLAMAFHLNATIGGDPEAMRGLLKPAA
jgi:Fe-S-cluster containining protein